MSRIHFIAIGGAAMHNLAIALKQNGHIVTGSDDHINEPSRTRLKEAGILPEKEGWFPERLESKPDSVILGMHARADNPELLKAIELGIPVRSFPEYLYEHSKNKKRIVIGGSHGKTSITSMILHVLRENGLDFDYMVGAQVQGFDTMVRLSDAPLIILEGDEYLSSPVDKRPKFHLYKPDIALISGIAWDHINVFPRYEDYVEQFRIFARLIPESGHLVYCDADPVVKEVSGDQGIRAGRIAYGLPAFEIHDGITSLVTASGNVPLKVFGNHNLMNLEGARNICKLLGVSDEDFYKSISKFTGAARRLQLIGQRDSTFVFWDFAHSPSKLKATVQAVAGQFPGKKIVACMELHTFSSLDGNFLNEYKGSMHDAGKALVYFNPATIAQKKLSPVSEDMVLNAFDRKDIGIYTNSDLLRKSLLDMDPGNTVFLLMSSGNFDGIDVRQLAEQLTGQTRNQIA